MAVTVVIGDLRQSVKLSGPAGPPVPDGDGGFTQPYAPLSPPIWRCRIQKATLALAEKHFAQAVIGRATHIVDGRFHPQIDFSTQLTWVDRAGVTHVGSVIDVDDTEGAGVETVVLVTEVSL